MIILASARTEDLDAATRAAIIEVCVAAHQEEDFRSLFSYVSAGGWHFLAWSDDLLLSHALVTTRWLKPEGHQLLKTAYVDAVATLPVGQGHGFGSAVLRYLADQVAPEYDIGCLETEQTVFYERLGWERWRGPLAGRNEQGLVPTPEQSAIMILRLPQTPALDLTTLLTIECQPGRIW